MNKKGFVIANPLGAILMVLTLIFMIPFIIGGGFITIKFIQAMSVTIIGIPVWAWAVLTLIILNIRGKTR